MLKTLSLTSIFVIISFFNVYSQNWVYSGNFPNDDFKGDVGGHGVAVDPDGKVWCTFYGATDSVFDVSQNVFRPTRAIYVFNADGSPTAFSPIKTVTVGGVTDTLYGSNRGLRTDHNGNILVSSFDILYRINYQTGEGMAKVQPTLGFSLTAPAVDDAGNVFIASVLPDNPIKVFTSDFTFLGNAVDASIGFSRTLEVSHDGNTIYWAGYTNNQVYIYSRPDEFSSFELQDSIYKDLLVNLLLGQPMEVSYGFLQDQLLLPLMHILGCAPVYSNATWYAWDPVTKTIVDNIKWIFYIPESPSERPRGLAFSPDGQYAYVTCFGDKYYPAFQKFEKQNITEYKVTFYVDMGLQVFEGNFNQVTDQVVVRGNFQSPAGDPGGDWQGSLYSLSDADGDTVYSITVTLPLSEAGNSFEYKYVTLPEEWEDTPNRSFTLTGPNLLLPSWFNNDNAYTFSTLLSWTGENGFEIDGVNPNSGIPNSLFTFNVKYSDIENDPPLLDYPKLHIKKGGVEIINSPFIMNEANTDPFTTGRIYTFDINTLESGSDYTYYFEAYDVNSNQASGEATIEQSGPVVNFEQFTEQTQISLPSFSNSVWGDIDNDGDLDIIACGFTGSVSESKIYQNENGIFTELTSAELIGVQYGSIELGDFDNDSYVDILLTGYTNDNLVVSKIYHNNGNLTFSDIFD